MHLQETETRMTVTTRVPVVSLILLGGALLIFVAGVSRHLRTPLQLPELLWGGVAVLAFIASGWLTAERGNYTFDKETKLFLWSRQRVGRRVSGKLSLSEVAQARYETLHASGADVGDLYRLTVETRHGKIPLTDAYSTGLEPIQKVVTQINRFVGGSS